LYSVARNGCLRRQRRSTFAPAREESLEALAASQLEALVAPTPGPDQQLAAEERRDSLDAALDTLDRGQREVIVLRDIEGLTAAEVATVLGVSVDAVKSRLHRARAALRRQLAPWLAPPAPEMAVAAAIEAEPCRDTIELFSRHLEGDLSGNACADMEAHLATCDACRGRCESLEHVLAICRASPAPLLPAEVDHSVRQALRDYLAVRS
jgi:RNA polymerase sigma-70 factor (ECF subfamily)